MHSRTIYMWSVCMPGRESWNIKNSAWCIHYLVCLCLMCVCAHACAGCCMHTDTSISWNIQLNLSLKWFEVWEQQQLWHFSALHFVPCQHFIFCIISSLETNEVPMVAQWARQYCVELHVSLFPRQLPKPCLDSIVSPLKLCWVMGLCAFSRAGAKWTPKWE